MLKVSLSNLHCLINYLLVWFNYLNATVTQVCYFYCCIFQLVFISCIRNTFVYKTVFNYYKKK